MELKSPEVKEAIESALGRVVAGKTLAQWVVDFKSFVQEVCEQGDVSHQFDHLYRVGTLATQRAIAEKADTAVVIPAAWLHDAVVVDKREPNRSKASGMAAKVAIDYLRSVGYPAQYEAAIAHAIEAHSFSANISTRSLEAEVVQDADRLDALGATGIARTLMLGGQWGSQLYDIHDPEGQCREFNDRHYALDHFFVKLFRLMDTMKTATGRKIAQQRTAFMRQYVTQLTAEIDGKG